MLLRTETVEIVLRWQAQEQPQREIFLRFRCDCQRKIPAQALEAPTIGELGKIRWPGIGESMRATEVRSRSIRDLSPESALRAHC